MQPLIKIQSIPIKIEAQTKRATLQHSTEPAPVKRAPRPAPRQVSAPAPAPQRQVKSEANPQPEQRVNQQVKTPQPQRTDVPNSYLQEASNAVQAYSQSNAIAGAPVSGVAQTPAPVAEQVQISAPESVPAQFAASTSFDYNMDRETFDWSTTSKPQLEYVPASIEYSVAQYPEVVIEYIGEPIYVPASSNPNYVPPPEAKGKA